MKLAIVLCFTVLGNGFASVIKNKEGEINKEVCYGKYGCFNTDAPWTSLLRPQSALPRPPYEVGTRFLLFTRSNRVSDFELVPDNDVILSFSPFNKTKETVFLIHGFTDSHMSPWMIGAKNAFLEKEDVNVISVDWAPGAKGVYLQATANIRLVAAQTYRLIKFLEEKAELNVSQLRIVGHSLGAHTAGYVGNMLRGELGTIVALDAAEPYFGGTDPLVRLDETDAKRVEVIHTNGDSNIGLGIKKPIGHIDIFPNGGLTQPGCSDLLGSLIGSIANLILFNFEGAIGTWACSHMRAVDFYVESINSNCPFIAQACDTYNNFNDGKCTTSCSQPGQCTVLGYGSEKHSETKGSYFLNTEKDSSFCVQNVRINTAVTQGQAKTHADVTVQFRRSTGATSPKYKFASGSLTAGLLLSSWQEVSSKVLISPNDKPSLILHYTRTGLTPILEPKNLALEAITISILDEDLKLHTVSYQGVTLEAGTDMIVPPLA